jgi:hypothetical protein
VAPSRPVKEAAGAAAGRWAPSASRCRAATRLRGRAGRLILPQGDQKPSCLECQVV